MQLQPQDRSHMIAESPRTRIARITVADAPLFLALLNSPAWIQFIGDRHVHTLEDAIAYVTTRMLSVYDTHGFGYYVVRLHDGTPIGICGFLKKPYLENVDFGFALLPAWHGLGLAAEAAEAVLSHGVKEFRFSVLDAVTVAENASSIRLLEALHFVDDGEIKVPGTAEPLRRYVWRERQLIG